MKFSKSILELGVAAHLGRATLIAAALSLQCAIAAGAPGGDGIAGATTRAAPSRQVLTGAAKTLVERSQQRPEQIADNVWSALGTYGQFLALLPLDRLTSVVLQSDAIELGFDFGGRERWDIELAARTHFLLAPRDPKHPELGGRVLEETCKGRMLSVKNRLRIELKGEQIAAIGAGQLRVKTCLGGFDIALTTEKREGALVREANGRIALRRDAAGEIEFRGERFALQRCDHWIVLRACGQTIEIPVSALSAA